MYKYNLCFLVYEDKVLMINRQKKPWMGCWNGIGGKLEDKETIEESVIREVYEETGIVINNPIFRGLLRWSENGAMEPNNGIYLYIVYLDKLIETPIYTREGILDFKTIDWIMNVDNEGVVKNIQDFLEPVLYDKEKYSFVSEYVSNNGKTIHIKTTKEVYHE